MANTHTLAKVATFGLFINEFEKFLAATWTTGNIVSTKQIKMAVRSLDAAHQLKKEFRCFVEHSGPVKVWNDVNYERISNYMKHVTGFYQSIKYKRRIKYGTNVQYVYVKNNFILMGISNNNIK